MIIWEGIESLLSIKQFDLKHLEINNQWTQLKILTTSKHRSEIEQSRIQTGMVNPVNEKGITNLH